MTRTMRVLDVPNAPPYRFQSRTSMDTARPLLRDPRTATHHLHHAHAVYLVALVGIVVVVGVVAVVVGSSRCRARRHRHRRLAAVRQR